MWVRLVVSNLNQANWVKQPAAIDLMGYAKSRGTGHSMGPAIILTILHGAKQILDTLACCHLTTQTVIIPVTQFIIGV